MRPYGDFRPCRWTISGTIGVAAQLVASTAHAWGVSARIVRGNVVDDPYANDRVGFEADVSTWSLAPGSIGLDVGWWEEMGSEQFSREYFPGNWLAERHSREIRLSVIVRMAARIQHARPYVVAGMGDYLLVRRDRCVRGGRTESQHGPGVSLGVGIRGATGLGPTLEARWHHVRPRNPTATWDGLDVLGVSVGVAFP